ncbi:glucokinase [Lentzea xinjiangensis]|uniref:Glucokinase n=1 Tax=Lentzea xinjiangensis TaxID=402600 RepID=A0A1H9AG95_9PSEU|nr:ROK family protein [Lentzea xinjiangensis]SEP75802.1 glucokinase [Lentzea xinjiangensis]
MARRHVVAVDIGGTETKAALVAGTSAAVAVHKHARRATPGELEPLLTVIAELVDGLRRSCEHEVDAVGVVAPGIVDEASGVGVYTSNLPWNQFPFGTVLTERLGVPVAFGHDVRAAGLAECRMGAAKDLRTAVIMPIGTGIAGALLLDGKIFAGGGYAGEIGHVDVGHGVPCACGQTGCVETVASSAAIARRYTARTGTPVNGAAEVARRVREGEQDAVAVWHEAVDALARGILVLATLLGPEAVVLGGGLALAGDLLVEPLRERLDGLIAFQRRPELRLAALGDEAGFLGAALLAIDMLEAS